MLRGTKWGAFGGLLFIVVSSAAAQQTAKFTYASLPSSSGSVMLGFPITITHDGSLLREAAFNCNLGFATVNSGRTTFFALPNGASAMGMNALLQVVGTDSNGEAFVVDRDGGVKTLSSVNGRTWAINDAGIMTGQMGNNGYIYSSDQPPALKSFNYPGSFSTIVRAINNVENVAGSYWLNGMTHGWTNIGHFATVDFPGANGTYCSSINYYGDVVGSYLTGKTSGGAMEEGGFLLKKGIFYNFVIPAPPSKVTTEGCMGVMQTYDLVDYDIEPSSINDFDEVVGGRVGFYVGEKDGSKITQVYSFEATPS